MYEEISVQKWITNEVIQHLLQPKFQCPESALTPNPIHYLEPFIDQHSTIDEYTMECAFYHFYPGIPIEHTSILRKLIQQVDWLIVYHTVMLALYKRKSYPI